MTIFRSWLAQRSFLGSIGALSEFESSMRIYVFITPEEICSGGRDINADLRRREHLGK